MEVLRVGFKVPRIFCIIYKYIRAKMISDSCSFSWNSVKLSNTIRKQWDIDNKCPDKIIIKTQFMAGFLIVIPSIFECIITENNWARKKRKYQCCRCFEALFVGGNGFCFHVSGIIIRWASCVIFISAVESQRTAVSNPVAVRG